MAGERCDFCHVTRAEFSFFSVVYYASAPRVGDIKRWCASDVCLSDVWRLSRKSRTERPMKTKIFTEVAHVTCDSDTTFKVKRSKVNLQGRGHIVAASCTACLYSFPVTLYDSWAVLKTAMCWWPQSWGVLVYWSPCRSRQQPDSLVRWVSIGDSRSPQY